jgi:hypothetical protein
MGLLFVVIKLPSIQTLRQPAFLNSNATALIPSSNPLRRGVFPNLFANSDHVAQWTPGVKCPRLVKAGSDTMISLGCGICQFRSGEYTLFPRETNDQRHEFQDSAL